MHKNLRLIKAILEAIEQSDNVVDNPVNLYEIFTCEEIHYHLNLLDNTDYIELVSFTDKQIPDFPAYCLTHYGVDFLNSLRLYE